LDHTIPGVRIRVFTGLKLGNNDLVLEYLEQVWHESAIRIFDKGLAIEFSILELGFKTFKTSLG